MDRLLDRVGRSVDVQGVIVVHKNIFVQVFDGGEVCGVVYPGSRIVRVELHPVDFDSPLGSEIVVRPFPLTFSVIATTDISRFVDLGFIASMQPTHATSDMNMAEGHIGTERIKGAYAWRSLLNQGATISAGSDLTVESANPFHGLPFFGSVFATPAAL